MMFYFLARGEGNVCRFMSVSTPLNQNLFLTNMAAAGMANRYESWPSEAESHEIFPTKLPLQMKRRVSISFYQPFFEYFCMFNITKFENPK